MDAYFRPALDTAYTYTHTFNLLRRCTCDSCSTRRCLPTCIVVARLSTRTLEDECCCAVFSFRRHGTRRMYNIDIHPLHNYSRQVPPLSTTLSIHCAHAAKVTQIRPTICLFLLHNNCSIEAYSRHGRFSVSMLLTTSRSIRMAATTVLLSQIPTLPPWYLYWIDPHHHYSKSAQQF